MSPTETVHRLGDMLAIYSRGSDDYATVQLTLVPASLGDEIARRRSRLDSPSVMSLPPCWQPMPARETDSLVQVAVREQGPALAFAQGRTMRNSPSTLSLVWRDQTITTAADCTRITTFLTGAAGLEVEHILEHRAGTRYLTCHSVIRNTGGSAMTLDAVSSFNLGGLTPFAPDDAPGRLRAHRFRSAWSCEARPEVRTFEELNLEPSWTGHGVRCERFGSLGSMPLNGWVPQAAVEDVHAGVTWAALLDVAGTWQMDFYRRKDEAAFSGGLGDREFGHWWKVLQPGECFTAPLAWVTVTDQPVERVWDRLLESYATKEVPAAEVDCPIIFNEWCTSWGNPTHANLVELGECLHHVGVKHLVIDDGWAERPPDTLIQGNGDWIVKPTSFPEGMAATVLALREQEFHPGVWFEFEVVNAGAKVWNETTHMLHRDGRVIQVGSRRFWDFRDPWVHDYLHNKVICFLRENRFRYLKVDYNDTIGLGVDGAESPGEGLRQHLDGVVTFFRRLRHELPDLVIENCSSGGHRHSSPFLRACSMSSFSDAHETTDIPIIAANLLPIVPSIQLQVWAVLRKPDNARRLHYSLAATFIGRMCLSGDVHELIPEQWKVISEGIAFYRNASPYLSEGICHRYGPPVKSYTHPVGWQALVRETETSCVIVAHTFGASPPEIVIPLPEGRWILDETFLECADQVILEDSALRWLQPGEFAGAGLRFTKLQ